ncbi:hypothetical protein CDD83_4104 [Cordyceps sp. RAO-2017]|nr:hypothetical protein CDD83_4104 [Cordyceps sp. RAO-2017]
MTLAGAGSPDWSSVFLVAVTVAVFLVPVFILFPPLPVERRDALRQTHRRLGLRRGDSNLARRAHHGAPARIQSLHVYPINSNRRHPTARRRGRS